MCYSKQTLLSLIETISLNPGLQSLSIVATRQGVTYKRTITALLSKIGELGEGLRVLELRWLPMKEAMIVNQLCTTLGTL